MASAASPETAGQQRLDGVVGRIADVEKDTADDAVLPGRADDLDGQRERLALRHRHLEAQALADAESVRSEERRGGKEWGSTCRSRWSPEDYKQKKKHNNKRLEE